MSLTDKTQKLLINQKKFIREVSKNFDLKTAIAMYNAFYEAGFLDDEGFLVTQ